MKRLLVLGLTLSAVLLLPVMASATHIETFTGNADCHGWSATIDVMWRSEVYSGDLTMVIVLANDQGDELESVVVNDTLTRDPDSSWMQSYTFSGEWQGAYAASYFVAYMGFELSAPYAEGTDVSHAGDEFMLECTVDDETFSWGTVKSLYR